MNFTRTASLASLFALVMILGVVAFFSPKNALAWSLTAQCSGQNQIVGTIDIPDDGTYNVFVEQRVGQWDISWVNNAGVNVKGPGLQEFTVNVSEARVDANLLRVRYKPAPNGTYGNEFVDLAPCRPAPAPTPLNLQVWDLQAECVDPVQRIYGGMIGIPADANGFPWVVFMEYAGPSGSPEDWHWVKPTGYNIGTDAASIAAVLGRNNNFEFTVPDWNPETRDGIPPGVTELRVRFKSLAFEPNPYGEKDNATFAPCDVKPTNPPTPCNCPTPVPPPTYEPIRVYPPPPPAPQSIVINNSSGSGSTSTSSGGGTSYGGGSGSCCSHGCCEEGNVTQIQGGQEITGPLVTINGVPCDTNCPSDNGDDGGKQGNVDNGDDNDLDWLWLVLPLAFFALLALIGGLAAFVALSRRNNSDDEDDDDEDEHATATSASTSSKDPPPPTA